MAAALKIRKLSINSAWVRCPGRGAGNVPRELTLIPSGNAVNATCGQRHAPRRGERQIGQRPQCFFQVEGLAPAQLNTMAQAAPGKPFRLTLPSGDIEGVLVSVGQAGANSSAARAAAAANAKTGAPAQAGPAKPAGRATGGAMAAAFGAVAAVAGAAGQIATAGASAVESTASLGREGIGAARDGIREAGAYGERRHERMMRDGDED